jgi:hypothetical protein
LNLPRFLFSNSSTLLIFSTNLLFALSRFGFFTNFYSLPIRLVVRCTDFGFCVFKMGVNVRAAAMFREASTFPFCIHIIFLVLSEPLHRLAYHDIFDCT